MRTRTRPTPLGSYYTERSAILIQSQNTSQHLQELPVQPTGSSACQKSSQDNMATMNVEKASCDQVATSSLGKDQTHISYQVACCTFCKISLPEELASQEHVTKTPRRDNSSPSSMNKPENNEQICSQSRNRSNHLKNVHNMPYTPPPTNIRPEDNPSFVSNSFVNSAHCDVCGMTFEVPKDARFPFEKVHKDNPKSHQTMHKKALLPSLDNNKPMTEPTDSAKANTIPKAVKGGFHCESCDKAYTGLFDYNIHIQTKHNKPNKPLPKSNIMLTRSYYKKEEQPEDWICSRCDKNFDTKLEYTTHIQTVQKNSFCNRNKSLVQKYCDVCELTFGTTYSLNVHISRKHTTRPTESQYWYCHECRRYYYRKSSYRNHRVSKHSTTMSSVPSSKSSMQPPIEHSYTIEHSVTANQPLKEWDPFILDCLSKTDQTPKAEEKSGFSCSSCDLCFMSRLKLKKHLKRMHNNTRNRANGAPISNYSCRSCNYQYSTKTTFGVHKYHSSQVSSIRKSPLRTSSRIKHSASTISSNTKTLTSNQARSNRFLSREKAKQKLLAQGRNIHRLSPTQDDAAPKNSETSVAVKIKPSKPQIIQPDINDPNNHCAACLFTYSTRNIYLIHLEQIHGMDNNKLDIMDDIKNEPDLKSCDFIFSSNSICNGYVAEAVEKTAITKQPISPILSLIDSKYIDFAVDNIDLSCQSNMGVQVTSVLHQTNVSDQQNFSLPSVIPVDEEIRSTESNSLPTQPVVCSHNTESEQLTSTNQEDQRSLVECIAAGKTITESVLPNQPKLDVTTVPALPEQSNPAATKDIPNLGCPTCRMTLPSQSSLYIHLTEVHLWRIPPMSLEPPSTLASDTDDPLLVKNFSNKVEQAITPPKRQRQFKSATPDTDTRDLLTFNCTSCHIGFASQASLEDHHKQIHRVSLLKRQKTDKKITVIPVSCMVCDTTSTSLEWHLRHLMKHHGIIQKPLILSCTPNNYIEPDTEDSNTVFCPSCNYTFESSNIHRKHLIDLHDLDLEPLSEDDPTLFNWYELENAEFVHCKICETSFSERSYFLQHMRLYHDVDLKYKEYESSQ